MISTIFKYYLSKFFFKSLGMNIVQTTYNNMFCHFEEWIAVFLAIKQYKNEEKHINVYIIVYILILLFEPPWMVHMYIFYK